MAKYVIHKKGFFYTDEAYEPVADVNGSIVGTYDQLDAAKAAKVKCDVASIQGLAGDNVNDFFFYHENYNGVIQKLEDFYKSDFGLTIEDKDYFSFPEEISAEQAQKFLEILECTFHDIVEYADDKVLDPADFDLEEQELGEF